MRKRILYDTLKFPSKLSKQAVDLMKKLLDKNPKTRLGNFYGAEDIKNHEWFKGVDWDKYLKKEVMPIWKPQLEKSNLDPEYTELPLDFDDGFKRVKTKERGFSIYYENSVGSKTVSDHSGYQSVEEMTVGQS